MKESQSVIVRTWGGGYMGEDGGIFALQKATFWDNGCTQYLDGDDGFLSINICQAYQIVQLKYACFTVQELHSIKLLKKWNRTESRNRVIVTWAIEFARGSQINTLTTENCFQKDILKQHTSY